MRILDFTMMLAVAVMVAAGGYAKGLMDGHSDMQRQILTVELQQHKTQLEAYGAQLQMVPVVMQTLQEVMQIAQVASARPVNDPTGKFLDDIHMKLERPCRSDGNNGGICDQPWQLVPKDKP